LELTPTHVKLWNFLIFFFKKLLSFSKSLKIAMCQFIIVSRGNLQS